jgi:hypothetical protein
VAVGLANGTMMQLLSVDRKCLQFRITSGSHIGAFWLFYLRLYDDDDYDVTAMRRRCLPADVAEDACCCMSTPAHVLFALLFISVIL